MEIVMRRIIPLVTLGALCFVAPLATPAQAAPASASVRYADLDLGRAEGRAALDRRIGHAVRTLCGDASAADPKGKASVRRCRAEARSSAAARKDQLIAAARNAGDTHLAGSQ
jgi:UrcA family protein